MRSDMNDMSWAGANLPQVLVVDDEAEIGAIVKYIAEEGGFAATVLDDPLKFPATYSRRFGTIVLDLSMPGADGIELLRFMARNRCEAGIVLMSGFDSQVLHAARELAAGYGLRVVGALRKPLDLDALAALLARSREGGRAAPRAGGAPALGVDELRRALSVGQVVPYYMPKVALADGAFVGVEALARWRHPQRGLVPPAQFVPLAEANGLISALTGVIVTSALAQCGEWRSRGQHLSVAVNVSARALDGVEFPDLLLAQARAHGVEPEQVIVELTESAVANDLAQSLDILTRLRMKKFGLSIDDFGTGYSSMQQLHRVPFTELKIDQSFVRDMATESQARSIVESTIGLGRSLGMTLVAEGVENAALWRELRRLGCEQAQGYYIGKPMPADEIPAWLDAWRGSEAVQSLAA